MHRVINLISESHSACHCGTLSPEKVYLHGYVKNGAVIFGSLPEKWFCMACRLDVGFEL
jgi:hypothetical protein